MLFLYLCKAILRIGCFLLLSGTVQNSLAQSFDEGNFTRYTKLDGLSNNYITGIIQDSAGYIWIGTYKGLNRFDGKFFTNFFKHTENSPIPENLVLSLRLQNQNEIIGTTVAGAFSYNTATRKHQYMIVPADSIIYFWTNQGWQALKDNAGNYIVSTKTGLYVFNPAGKIICRYDHYSPGDAGKTELWFGNWLSTLNNGSIFQENNLAGSVYHPAANKIDSYYVKKTKKLAGLINGKKDETRISFPGNHNEIFVPDAEAGVMNVYNLLTGEHSSHFIPVPVLSDINWHSKLFYINDSLFAITSKVNGFYLFHYSPLQKKIDCDAKKYFASKYCTSLFSDQQGRLWIGTNDGLYKQNIRHSFFTVDDLSQQLPSIMNTGVQAIFISKEKTFVGLGNEGGLLVLDNKTKKIQRHISLKKFGDGSNTINFIFSYHADTLWCGTGKGILWININNYSVGKLNIPGQPAWFYQTKTRTYLQDSEKNIWLSFGRLNSVVMFDRLNFRIRDFSKSPLLKITFCFSMIEDLNRNIWLAGDGFCRWNRAKNEIDTLIPYPTVTHSLFNFVRLIDCDSNNNLWLTSFDNEIIQYSNSENKMYLRLPENSMLDGYAVTNSPIIENNIWLGMLNGISAFNIKDFSVKQFNYSDGLPSTAVTSYRNGSFYDGNENLFYFGAGQYLISFTPDIHLSNKPVPTFSIEMEGVNKALNETISLSYSQNDIELRFNAINFTDPEENRFAYRLLNKKDSSWRELVTKNLVLGELPAGNHAIQVKLYSMNNRWSPQIKMIAIVIRPPFWKTPWFMLFSAIAILTGIYFLYRYRIRQISQKANLDKLLAQTEMKALHAQMNPHFIFNCLNSIREMILNNENEQASLYLSKFARLIRITLNQSSKQFVSLADTIDYLDRYVEMEKIRSSYFSYTIDIDRSLDTGEIMVPPMLIQPFIENAIWHGVSSKKNMEVSVRFSKKENELVCMVEDNGIGIDESLRRKENIAGEPSVGIENIKQRISLLNEKYNLNSSVRVEDKSAIPGSSGTGTIVTLHLSLKTNEMSQ